MPAPLIGITTRNTLSEIYRIPLISSPRSYTQAIIRAGAIPVLVPLNLPTTRLEELLPRLDGVIFTGGGDIETSRFNGVECAQVGDVDLERDEMELSFIEDVTRAEKPFLGICRGAQVLNVARGGCLYTHIADQLEGAVEHAFFPGYPGDHLAHPVQIEEDSRLGEIIKKPIIEVNSLHHQGVKDLGRDLRIVARAPDGLPEALELEDYPVFNLAVQWHPEWLSDVPEMAAIFTEFVQAASSKN